MKIEIDMTAEQLATVIGSMDADEIVDAINGSTDVSDHINVTGKLLDLLGPEEQAVAIRLIGAAGLKTLLLKLRGVESDIKSVVDAFSNLSIEDRREALVKMIEVFP